MIGEIKYEVSGEIVEGEGRDEQKFLVSFRQVLGWQGASVRIRMYVYLKFCLYLMLTCSNLKEKFYFIQLIRIVREIIIINTGNI